MIMDARPEARRKVSRHSAARKGSEVDLTTKRDVTPRASHEDRVDSLVAARSSERRKGGIQARGVSDERVTVAEGDGLLCSVGVRQSCRKELGKVRNVGGGGVRGCGIGIAGCDAAGRDERML